MKIKFKLDKRQMYIWGGFLEATKSQQDYQLVKLLIEGLLLRLKQQVILDKGKYSFSIPYTEGLAFIEHAEEVNVQDIPEVELITINQIIGIIDQKTK